MLDTVMLSLAELQNQNLKKMKVQVLEMERQELCSNLDPSYHFPFLRSAGVLTRDEQETIGNIKRYETTSASTGRLLDIIATKPQGFDALCNSIREEGTQMFLLERLNRSLEALINHHNAINGNAWSEPPSEIDALGLPLPPAGPETEAQVDEAEERDSVQDSDVTCSTGVHSSNRSSRNPGNHCSGRPPSTSDA